MGTAAHFAFVMRAQCSLVCIDIDGKNGGLIHAPVKLEACCAHTLAGASKSGDGYHLWYATSRR